MLYVLPFFKTLTHFLFTPAVNCLEKKEALIILQLEFEDSNMLYFYKQVLPLICFLFIDTDDTVHQSESSLLKKEIGSAYPCGLVYVLWEPPLQLNKQTDIYVCTNTNTK